MNLKLGLVGLALLISLVPVLGQAQELTGAPLTGRERALLERIDKLEQRISALEATRSSVADAGSAKAPTEAANHPVLLPAATETALPTAQVASSSEPKASSPASPLAFSDGTTLSFSLDGYYGYNFNHPIGRLNLLRANDVTANNFSLNQMGFIVERAPDATVGRRLGYRVDLMFGQSTEAMQGSAQNEPRPQVYRNLFQAYGSYVVPIGSGLQVDFGKFASTLGYEGNYTKDQLNYSRSYLYNFLPYYHMGLRATYNLNRKLSAQYWLVNGVGQTEDFNGFKSQAVLLTYKPTSHISWTGSYYEGQEQRDVNPLLNPGFPLLPSQPGLSADPVTSRFDGRLHIVDTVASFNLGPNWLVGGEGDYVTNRIAANAAPAVVYGGAGYLHRQMTKAVALNGRFTYLKDRNGLFSGASQDLKSFTATAVYDMSDGLQTKLEFRRDFSNQLFFLTNNPGALQGHQNTATLGLVWWFGGKTGAW